MANNPVLPKLKVATDDYREQAGRMVGDETMPPVIIQVWDDDLADYRDLNSVDLADNPASSVETPISMTVTTTATQASTGLACMSVLFRADPDNTQTIYCGNNNAQTFPLLPGESFAVRISNLSPFFFKTSTSTATLHVLPVSE